MQALVSSMQVSVMSKDRHASTGRIEDNGRARSLIPGSLIAFPGRRMNQIFGGRQDEMPS